MGVTNATSYFGEYAMNFLKILIIAGWGILSAPAILAADHAMGAKGGHSAADHNAIASAISARIHCLCGSFPVSRTLTPYSSARFFAVSSGSDCAVIWLER